MFEVAYGPKSNGSKPASATSSSSRSRRRPIAFHDKPRAPPVFSCRAQTGSASLIRPAAERSRFPLSPRTSVWLPWTTPYGASASTASNLRFPKSAAD